MKQYFVYLHAKPNGDIFYVGKGRSKRRCHDFKTGRNLHHRNIVAKYGAENIQVFCFPEESNESAIAAEIAWIKQLREDGVELANRTDGGEGALGRKWSDETRAKILLALAPHHAATAARSRGKQYCLGRKHTTEEKMKMSLKSRGRKLTVDQRAKLSQARKGIKSRLGAVLSESTKKKISASVSAAQVRLGKPQSNGSSGFRGVSKEGKKWRATIRAYGITYRVGVFDTPSEAHIAYLAKKEIIYSAGVVS